MKLLVSVIVPVYNPGDALRLCIETLLAQTYSNLEVIVVNDGSTDGSDDICKGYAAIDNRVTYVHQKNAGVSAARNRGLESAHGEYICFVDADDYVDSDYVQAMVDVAEKSEADLVIQGLKQIKDGKCIKTDLFEDGVYHVSSLNDEIFDKIFYFCGPYCKLFKRSIIESRNLRFPLGLSYGEDAVFYHAYLENCKEVVLISATSYNYMVANQGALSTKTLPPDKFWLNQCNRRCAYRRLKSIFGLEPKLSDTEQTSKLIGVSGMLSSIFKSGCNDSDVQRYLDMMLSDSNFKFSDIRPTSISDKIILTLVKSNNRLSRFILKKAYL